jgi:signal transduction histidine kinase
VTEDSPVVNEPPAPREPGALEVPGALERRAVRPAPRTLNDITHSLASVDEAPTRVRHVLGLLWYLVPYDHAALLDTRPDRDPHFVVVPETVDGTALGSLVRRLLGLLAEDAQPSRSSTSTTARSPFPLAPLHLEDDPLADHLSAWGSHLAVPLIGVEGVTGLLFIGRALQKAYDEEHLGWLSVVAGQLAAYLTTLYLWERDARHVSELEEGIRLRDAVLAMASHDLKNPLTTIKGIAQLLHRRLSRLDAASSPDRDRLAAAASSIDVAATKMVSQIGELLNVARLGLGERPALHRRSTDLVALTRQVAAAHQETARTHHIIVDASDSEVVGEWDAEQLERVVENLIGNAVKYSPLGGDVRVTVSLADAALGDAAAMESADDRGEVVPAAVLRVEDQGIGIPASDLSHVFEPFQRAGNVDASFPGTGIGLASVHSIVRQHDGTIMVESQVGRGSVFTVRLPLVPGATTAL